MTFTGNCSKNDMKGSATSPKVPVKFAEVAVYFSKEEWKYLEEGQKELYKDVMIDNYQTISSLGCPDGKPEIVTRFEKGQNPCVRFCVQKRDFKKNISTGEYRSTS
ncbi:hypothetical protein FKM82_015963 [Ascaphus truei]